MHSSGMHTARSSSRPGAGSPPGPPFCYGLLVWWPSGVVAFSYGLLPPRRPYQKAAFNPKATKPEGHNRRHNRRPQQKAITEGQAPLMSRQPLATDPPWDQVPPPQDQAPPSPRSRPPRRRIPLPPLQGMLG